MSKMLEIYYAAPRIEHTDAAVAEVVRQHRGEVTFFEQTKYICLTAEFSDLDDAENAAEEIRKLGLHVEGPCDY